MKNEKEKSKNWKWYIITASIIIVAVIGVYAWYSQIKIPHDEAIKKFNVAVEQVEQKNAELDATISTAQAVLDAGEQPYDETAINDVTAAISNARLEKRELPALPDKTDAINSTTEELLKPLDYSTYINDITAKTTALENSIIQMKQITNPNGDFIVQRLQNLDNISACQAVTEDHDPNGKLNKQGGYTAAIYFSSPLVNQTEVSGNDIVEKGTDCGGCIEVYASAEDAENRNAYLAAFDGGIFSSGSHVVLGTILIRTSDKLTATQ